MTADKQPTAVFFGTPKLAAVIVEELITGSAVDIKAVVTNPDRPIGRGKYVESPPVKRVADQYDIQVLQPEKANDPDLRETLEYFNPDLLIVAAYGHILPETILAIPNKGALNVHPSLLPAYRGPSPIAAAIDSGEKETGVTIILMDEEMDHGPILVQKKTALTDTATTETLTNDLAEMGATLLVGVIPQWISGEIDPVEQDHTKATYTTLLTKESGQIDWSESAEVVERHVRAFHPWPSAWTTLPNEKRLKILKAAVHQSAPSNEETEEGQLEVHENSPIVHTGNGALALLEVQIEGKDPISGKDFLNGYTTLVGQILT